MGEAYFIVEGDVEFLVNGERFGATAGDFVHTPGGTCTAFPAGPSGPHGC